MAETKWTVGKMVTNSGQRPVMSEAGRVCLVDIPAVGDRDEIAARIVLAVNSHDALVEALEACLDHCMNEWTSDDPRAVKARAALKDAAS